MSRPLSFPPRILVAVVAVVGLVGCSSGAVTVSGSLPPSPTTAPTASRPPCPNPTAGGVCLGALAPGEYTSLWLHPQLTYTVPAGWTNTSDYPGDFGLLPPGSHDLGGNLGASQFVGVYPDIAVGRPDCGEGPAPRVGITPKAISGWITHHPGLVSTPPRAVTFGKLTGVVQDITLAKTWTKKCPWSEGTAVVPLITGIGKEKALGGSDFDHSIPGAGWKDSMPPNAIRLYLLPWEGGTLAIEVDDATGGDHLDFADSVINSFRFGP
jgi:hypothetical protein